MFSLEHQPGSSTVGQLGAEMYVLYATYHTKLYMFHYTATGAMSDVKT